MAPDSGAPARRQLPSRRPSHRGYRHQPTSAPVIHGVARWNCTTRFRSPLDHVKTINTKTASQYRRKQPAATGCRDTSPQSCLTNHHLPMEGPDVRKCFPTVSPIGPPNARAQRRGAAPSAGARGYVSLLSGDIPRHSNRSKLPNNVPTDDATSAVTAKVTSAIGHKFWEVESLNMPTSMARRAPDGTAIPITIIVRRAGLLPTTREMAAVATAATSIAFVPMGNDMRGSSMFQDMPRNPAISVARKAEGSQYESMRFIHALTMQFDT